MLKIVKSAIKSNDSEVLLLGLKHCSLTRKAMKNFEIKHDEINSSEKEIKSLEDEIAKKLRPFIAAALVVETAKELSGPNLFGINPN